MSENKTGCDGSAPLLDKLGIELQSSLAIEAFSQASHLKEVVDKANELRAAIIAIETAPVAAFLPMRAVLSDLKMVVDALEWSEPYTQCPYYPDCTKTRCKVCEGNHWLPKARYLRVPRSVRTRHEEQRDGTGNGNN